MVKGKWMLDDSQLMEKLKIIVVVCIHDRWENLRRWIHAWNMCEQIDAALIFVNNHHDGTDIGFWEDYCRVRNVILYNRGNIGFETGIIQDVITGKLFSDIDWNVFFSATDDSIPMKKDFLVQYMNELIKPDVGVVAMEVSGNYTPHIRTTGWCIKKEIAKDITFAHEIIDDKGKCYEFEHTGGEATLMAQILRMDKRVVQLSNIADSAIWDTDHTKLNRWAEWHEKFPNYNG